MAVVGMMMMVVVRVMRMVVIRMMIAVVSTVVAAVMSTVVPTTVMSAAVAAATREDLLGAEGDNHQCDQNCQITFH